MIHITKRLSTVKPSASMLASQAAKKLATSGVDVIDLGQGEPDFAAPHHITDAAFAAASTNRMLYTAPLGTLELRRAVCEKFNRENGLKFDVDEVAVANGAKQIIFNALLATVEQGDELIFPAPYFVSYPEMAKLFGGIPVTPKGLAENNFRITPEMLEAVITPQTRWLFLNMPGNPSGAVYSREQLEAIGAVLEQHPHVMILSDEIYEHIIFDGREFVSFGAACPQLRDRTLIVNGVSKAYAMTGWRVGYAAGPSDLIKAMGTVQSQSCTSVSAPAQHAAQVALEGPQEDVARFCEAYQRRRDLVVEGVRQISALTLDPPEGAFYAYIGCAKLIGAKTPSGAQLDDDVAVADYLLLEGHVASVPGSAYGLSPYFRISTATSDAELTEAIARIGRAVAKLKF